MTATQTQPATVNHYARLRQMVIDEVEGRPADRKELREVLFELNQPTPAAFDKAVRLARRRLDISIAKQRYEASRPESEQLNAEESAAREKDVAEIKRLKELLYNAQCMPNLSQWKHQNADRVVELSAIQSGYTRHDASEMVSTAHPRLHSKLATLNHELLEIGSGIQAARDTIDRAEKKVITDNDGRYMRAGSLKKSIQDIEDGLGVVKIVETHFNYAYWVSERDAVAAELEEPSYSANRDSLLKRLVTAGNKIATIDKAREEIARLEKQGSEVRAQINNVSQYLRDWKAFDIELSAKG